MRRLVLLSRCSGMFVLNQDARVLPGPVRLLDIRGQAATYLVGWVGEKHYLVGRAPFSVGSAGIVIRKWRGGGLVGWRTGAFARGPGHYSYLGDN